MSLEEIIRRHVDLPPPEATGFHKVLCPVCHDHGRKGKRAGWKFDGDTTGYSCFNCGAKAKHEPPEQLSNNMREILRAFGIDDTELGEFAIENLQADFTKTKIEKPVNYEPRVIEFPESTYRLSAADDNDKWADFAWYYLEERGQDPLGYPYYISKHKDWVGRIIIPEFKDGRLVFYQGRDLTDKKRDKYLSPGYSKENIIHGFDLLRKDYDLPLFVTEGVFDALLIGGAAIFGNTMTPGQEHWLNSTRRQKVFIPDRWGYGKRGKKRIADRCLELGWSVSLPEFGSDVKDITDAMIKYGRLFVISSLMSNIVSGDLAQMKLSFYYQ